MEVKIESLATQQVVAIEASETGICDYCYQKRLKSNLIEVSSTIEYPLRERKTSKHLAYYCADNPACYKVLEGIKKEAGISRLLF